MKTTAAINPGDAYKTRGTLTRVSEPRPRFKASGVRNGYEVDAVCGCHVCGTDGVVRTYPLPKWQAKFNDSTCKAGARRRSKRAAAHTNTPRFDGITAERVG